MEILPLRGDRRTGFGRTGRCLAVGFARSGGCCPDADTRLALVSGFIVFVVLQCLLAAWVHHVFEVGLPRSLSADRDGVTDPEAAHGVRPRCHGRSPITGWDGQFYYHVSNDLLGTQDTRSTWITSAIAISSNT